MGSDEALRLVLSIGLLLFFTRPFSGLVFDAFKVMLRLALAGLVLAVIPLDFLDEWSKTATGWAHISAVYVPTIALMLLVALSTANLVVLSGTKAEQFVRLGAYIIGGVFTIGSADWITWERAVGSVVIGVFGIAVGTLRIFATPLGAKL
jgi:hypothetical protein